MREFNKTQIIMKNKIDINRKDLREFYSMSEFVKSIGNTQKVWSWGAHAYTKMNKFFLRFKVEAHRHKGHVYVAVNGADLFDVTLTSVQGSIIKEFHDIYIEDFIRVIDDEIENIPEYSQS